MEFSWSSAQLDYRRRVREFLSKEMPSDWPLQAERPGSGKSMPSTKENYSHGIASKENVAFSRKFCPKLAAEGLFVPQWPKEFGGQDAKPWMQFILAEELWAWGEPRGPQYLNVSFIGYCLMKYGTPEQKEKHLKMMADGRAIWCEGFSEAQAGTDLAALQTSAKKTPTGYRINGSKRPISYGLAAEWCFLLARTGPERKNITAFIVPMSAPGIKVVPIPALHLDGHMTEIIFEDVEVPDFARLGEEGHGFEVALFGIDYERVGTPRYHMGRLVLDLAVAQLKREGRWLSDPIVRGAAGRLVAELEAARVLTYIVIAERAKDFALSVATNVQRVTACFATLHVMDFISEYVPDVLAGGDRYLQFYYRCMLSQTFGTGPLELQLDFVAHRALSLPRNH
jgi:alkylation response protein AidB-like acyl-CoA dehydrogenase